MCSIFLSIDEHPEFPLILAANRDEFLDRDAERMNWRQMGAGSDVLCGIDLLAGGTWLGVTRDARWSVVTNIRNFHKPIVGDKSRGELPLAFLRSQKEPKEFTDRIKSELTDFSGFNLLVGSGQKVAWVNNQNGLDLHLDRGVHGLSNALLNTPWPKVERGKSLMQEALKLDSVEELSTSLFRLLEDQTTYPEVWLPDTGIGLEKEKMLSSIFIRSAGYGTRVSTVVLIDRKGGVQVMEKGHPSGQVLEFKW